MGLGLRETHGVGWARGLATMVVAGLDHGRGWSAIVPAAGQVLGALAIAAGYGLATWAKLENRFFSSVARIQQDRGQTVVSRGPYCVVRHPGYLGAILAALGLPPALIPAGVIVAAFVVRTGLEDRMLRDELEGYRSYAARTRYRLIPGLW